jgi:hypothetical protein
MCSLRLFRTSLLLASLPLLACIQPAVAVDVPPTVHEDDQVLQIETMDLRAAFSKQGYVTGIKGQSFVDKKTGFHDLGFGLDIVDWIMEPGSDEAYRDGLDKELVYTFNNSYHGKTPKRSIEGPQICTQAKSMKPEVVRGPDFLAVKQTWQYRTAAPGKQTGSTWTQWIVFPKGKRYFISMDRIDAVNSSDAMFLRLDMPGHIRHKKGDSFEKVYLSYAGEVAPSEFEANFAPDEKFNYRRGVNPQPERMIRGYKIRDPQTGKGGPWLVGMTLDPGAVSEAWCHQRDYICMIEEFGGRPVKAGESFSAAFIVGYFDSIDEMNKVYDEYKGAVALEVNERGWTLLKE